MKPSDSIAYDNHDYGMICSRFSHEIGNPLSIVLSELRLISGKYPEISNSEEWNTIQENLDYIRALLHEFSDYHNAEKLCKAPTDISAYLRDVAIAVKPAMEYLGIAFAFQTESELPKIAIDRIKMRQALLNLIQNAQDAVPDHGGCITLSTRQTSDHQILISVSDNGCGIDPELLPEIFTPFITFKEHGTGLGLAITKQIVEAHHGHLSVESTPGIGTTFLIRLAL